MRTASRIFPIVIFLPILFCVTACSKKDGPKGAAPGAGGENPPGGPPGGNTCNAQKADAENITIFPADNAWNQDISGAAVDPYSSQILSAISSTVLKADFGSGLYEGAIIGISQVR